MKPEIKKKVNTVLIAIALIVLILGLVPGFISYKTGLVAFVFLLVAAGIVKVSIPEPEPIPPDESKPENPQDPTPKI